jgi:hypothetical protein
VAVAAPLVPSRRGGYGAPLLVFVVAAAVSFGTLLVAGINRADEAWNLHLIQRMLDGDALYRDVRYYPTPLAMFAGAAVASVLGVKLVVLKGLVAASFGVTAVASLAIVRRLGAGRRGQLLLVVLLLLFALPPASSLYNTLAIALASTTALLALRWDAALDAAPGPARTRRLFGRAAATGLAAGACLLTKYNVGAAVALAVAACMAVAAVQRRATIREAGSSVVTAAGAVLLTFLAGMVPVLVQGAGPSFVDQLLEGRSLLGATVPYDEGWRNLVDGVGRLAAPDMRTFAAFALLPAAGVIGLLAALRARGADRGRLLALMVFSLAAAVLAVPRADHVTWVAPVPLTLLVASASHLARPAFRTFPRAAAGGQALCVGFALMWLVLASVGEVRAARDFRRVPGGPFAGALLAAGQWQEIDGAAKELRSRIGADAKVLILSQEAGLLYMAGGMRNPTPYDYPDAFEFGAGGLARVKAALVNYTINYTCISRRYGPGLEPVRVIAAVQARSRLVARLRACELWVTSPTGQPRA